MQDSFVLHIKFVVKVLAYFIQVIWDSDVFWKIFLPQYDFSKPECASALEDSRFSITENLIVRRELSHIWKLGCLLLFSIPSCHLQDLIRGKNGKLLEQIFGFL